ncbi:hypothetical protein M1437_00645 [Patescibacteria group bacterium]|nr:hypothetical protein [Patescibacteria group bacterium]
MERNIKKLINKIDHIDTLPAAPVKSHKKMMEYLPRFSLSEVKTLNYDMVATHIVTAFALPIGFAECALRQPRETLRFLKTNGLQGIVKTHLSLQKDLYRQIHSP